MTEEEKRALALQIMEQATARLRNRSPLDASHANLSNALKKSAERRQAYASLAQKGISWEELQEAFSSAYEQGKRDMVTFHLTFFYCSLAIALHERFQLSPSSIKEFIQSIETMMNDEHGREELLARCQEQTGIDTTFADVPAVPDRSTRKDLEAVNRMVKTGITSRDLEKEREIGYYLGRNSGFFLSAGYAGVALLLAAPDAAPGLTHLEIEDFLCRMDEITTEEIGVADILERAKREAGIDASEIASEKNYKF